jgi:hypothetical protein
MSKRTKLKRTDRAWQRARAQRRNLLKLNAEEDALVSEIAAIQASADKTDLNSEFIAKLRGKLRLVRRERRGRQRGRPAASMTDKLVDWAMVEHERGLLDPANSQGDWVMSVEEASRRVAARKDMQDDGCRVDRRVERHHAEVSTARSAVRS